MENFAIMYNCNMRKIEFIWISDGVELKTYSKLT